MFAKTYKAVEASHPIMMVEGINHTGAALCYATRIYFDSKKYDPNGLAKLAVRNYIKKNRELFYFKNGNQRKNFPIEELNRIIKKYARV